jgi:hypothetical protein
MSWHAFRAAATLFAALMASPVCAGPSCAEQKSPEPATLYVVQAGDTLWRLGQRYFVSPADAQIVQHHNQVGDARRLRAGRTLSVPNCLLRTEATPARLGAFRGLVVIAMGGRSLPVALGMTLGEDALVATGSDAFARLDLADGSRVALPSNSRLRIGKLSRTLMTGAVQRDFTVEAGRAVSTVIPMHNPLDSYIVRTPLSAAAVRGTVFRVRYDPSERRQSTEVLEGHVLVSAAAASALAPAGYGVVSSDAGVQNAQALPPPPPLLAPGRVQSDRSVRFEVQPGPYAKAYHFEIAQDAGFLSPVAERTTNGPLADFDGIPDGEYFVRDTVIGEDGLESAPATYAFERWLSTLSTATPQALGAARQHSFLFRWDAAGAGHHVYRFQLSGSDGGPPLVDQLGLSASEIALTDLPPGKYSWRVMSITFDRGRHVETWSPSQTFQIGDQAARAPVG